MASQDEARKIKINSKADGRRHYFLYFAADGRVRFCTCKNYIFVQRKMKGSCKHMKENPTMEVCALNEMRRAS